MSATAFARRAAAVLFLAAALAGCAGAFNEEAFVSPGKFHIYSCRDIELRARKAREREEELRLLMQQAERGPAGGLVNAVAYRTDYMQTRGELKLLAATAAEKNCAAQSPWTSERSLF